jgi:hypothetical protein
MFIAASSTPAVASRKAEARRNVNTILPIRSSALF